ncbi:NAD(P)-dependent dehydrogenase (short-subunit alcohol dehydrogenase family) [Lipingzhangella halophila]|uniref:NAD(P)-dependent dehydrogenase (Short-subunit alcohol dehydrogenase family) n=1 Tax=Lipingzhangella halophila TaxID=1783352 RepID=A0A7W7RDH9_9ACTN|nr:SDR family NAD(P)-dependent oxidoreductase [Lipingzhangella halophila]MBB4929989.1 NAD(P)-dependent dehydrogenase (short-subunit alcohol dehydrogenase family) [Lipingzhangella halophila]
MPIRPLVIAITGANSGIGLRAAERLAADGHTVLAICRSQERGAAALERINAAAAVPARLVLADLAEPASIEAAAQRLHDELDQLDVLINNAAVFDQTMHTPQFTSAGHEFFWATNHLGPHLLTAALSDLLAAAADPRVINVASKGLVTMPRIRIRFEELDDPSWYSPTKAYYHAKLAQIMTTFQLALRTEDMLDVACVRVPAVRLDADRVAALPWWLRTLYAPKNRLATSPGTLAETYARVATRDRPGAAHANHPDGRRDRFRGIYVDENALPVPAPAFAYDDAARARLWEVSQEATGNPRWAW